MNTNFKVIAQINSPLYLAGFRILISHWLILWIYFILVGVSQLNAQDSTQVDSLERSLNAATEDTSKVKILNTLSSTMWMYGNKEKGSEYANRALAICKEFSEKSHLIAVCYSNIGATNYLSGNYPEALKNWQNALQVYQSFDDLNGIASTSGNLGITYLSIGEYEHALEYLRTSLDAYKEDGDSAGMARQYNNLGNTYDNVDDYEAALEHHKMSYNLGKARNDKDGMAGSLVNIGNFYDRDGLYAEALENYYQALDLFKEIGNKSHLPICYINIGDTQVKQGNYSEAEKHIKMGKELAEELGFKESIKLAYEAFVHLYDSSGNFRNAYINHVLYTDMKDTLFNEDKSKEIGRLEAKHEFEMAEQERIRKEEEQSEIETVQKSRRDNLQYSGILIFMVLIFAGVFFIGRINIPIRLAEGMIFFSFLLFFEFTLVLLDPYIEQYSSGAPAIKLGFNAILAGLIFPLHSLFEEKLKKRIVP